MVGGSIGPDITAFSMVCDNHTSRRLDVSSGRVPDARSQAERCSVPSRAR